MKNTCKFVTLTIPALIAMTSFASAATITFEGDYSAFGGQEPIDTPYVTDGFTFTPSEPIAFLSDSTAGAMVGNSTDWLGFTDNSKITITGVTNFNLTSIDLGSFDDPNGVGISSFTINAFNGAELVGTVTTMGSTELTHVDFDNTFENLSSVEITFFNSNSPNTPISGIDNVGLQAVPEPSAALLGGLGALALLRRRRN